MIIFNDDNKELNGTKTKKHKKKIITVKEK